VLALAAIPIYVSQRQIYGTNSSWVSLAHYVQQNAASGHGVYFAPRYESQDGTVGQTIRGIATACPVGFRGLVDISLRMIDPYGSRTRRSIRRSDDHGSSGEPLRHIETAARQRGGVGRSRRALGHPTSGLSQGQNGGRRDFPCPTEIRAHRHLTGPLDRVVLTQKILDPAQHTGLRTLEDPGVGRP